MMFCIILVLIPFTFGSSTFAVSDVEIGPLLPTISLSESLSSLTSHPIESHSVLDMNWINCKFSDNLDPFLCAIGTAFDKHLPLVLSPDVIWYQIMNSFAEHVNRNAELLRNKIVEFQGKKTIIVRNDSFLKGAFNNDWESVFSQFTDQIKEHIGEDLYQMIINDFSTSTTATKAASEILLMNSVQKYFTLDFITMCGIPEITLEGNLDDWTEIRLRAEKLKDYSLDWWLDELLPVLDQFISAYSGNIDPDFWRSFFKVNDGSGGPWITGWINVFYPFTKEGTNYYVQNWKTTMNNSFGGGLTPSEIPWGFKSAPFTWKYHIKEYDMDFLSGFVGVSQNKTTNALKPELGWMVGERK